MPPGPRRAHRLKEATLTAVANSAAELTAAARDQMEQNFRWYQDLSAQERSWVGLVAQSGISQFIEWVHDPVAVSPSTATIFGSAPRELTRRISLRQTLDLVRTVVDVVEDRVGAMASRGDETFMRESILRYSREIAFAAAEVYAGAAEARGAWDARLEALVVDAVLRGEADDSMASRASALGWDQVADVTFVVGQAPDGSAAEAVHTVRRAARRLQLDALATVQRSRLIVILGGTREPFDAVDGLVGCFGPGPIVLGPTVPHLFAAGRSARAALSGFAAAPGWPAAPRPTMASELLPERALSGDETARRTLIEHIYRPLREPRNEALLETATALFMNGGALEATARELIVHTNTVRYRLGRINDLTGYDVTDPRDAFVVQLALTFGRLRADAPAAPRVAGVAPLEDLSKSEPHTS